LVAVAVASAVMVVVAMQVVAVVVAATAAARVVGRCASRHSRPGRRHSNARAPHLPHVGAELNVMHVQHVDVREPQARQAGVHARHHSRSAVVW
jgi:hypothetical protein